MKIDEITDQMVIAWFKARAAKYGTDVSIGFHDGPRPFFLYKDGIGESAETTDEAFNKAKQKFASRAIKWGFKQ